MISIADFDMCASNFALRRSRPSNYIPLEGLCCLKQTDCRGANSALVTGASKALCLEAL